MVFHLDHSQLCISPFERRCKGTMAKKRKIVKAKERKVRRSDGDAQRCKDEGTILCGGHCASYKTSLIFKVTWYIFLLLAKPNHHVLHIKCNAYNSVYVLPDFRHLHQSAYPNSILWVIKHCNIWISLYQARVQRWEWSQLQNMHLIAYITQITILQSRSSKSEQLKKPPLYTRTKYCLILDLFRNKTHPDTQTRIRTITAPVLCTPIK